MSSPANSHAPFLPTSTWFPEDFPAFRLKFLEIYRNIANNSNVRQIGVFDQVEFLTGEQFFDSSDPQSKRQTYRKCFNIGAIATNTTSTTAHNISNLSSLSHAYGTCTTDVPDFRPIPYSSTTNWTEQIELKVTSTDIVIDVGLTAPNLTACLVVLEYFRS